MCQTPHNVKQKPDSLFGKSSFILCGHCKRGQSKTAGIYEVQRYQGKGAPAIHLFLQI